MKQSYRRFLKFIILMFVLGCDGSTGIEPNGFPTSVEKDGVALSLNSPQSPNAPLVPSTEISFSIPEPGRVRLAWFNATGYEIKLIVDEVLPTGTHTFIFQAINEDGEPLKTGVYVVELKYKDLVQLQLHYLLQSP